MKGGGESFVSDFVRIAFKCICLNTTYFDGGTKLVVWVFLKKLLLTSM